MHLSALFWTCKTSLILASLALFCLCAYQCLYTAACRKKARGGKSSRAARPLCVPMYSIVPLLLLYSLSILAEALIHIWVNNCASFPGNWKELCGVKRNFSFPFYYFFVIYFCISAYHQHRITFNRDLIQCKYYLKRSLHRRHRFFCLGFTIVRILLIIKYQ